MDISDYERRGDVDAPFEVTKKQEKAQAERERMRDAVRCETPPLTREEYEAGAPCPGCGLPFTDDQSWRGGGTMYWTDDERARHEAEEQRFKAAHGDCHSSRWTSQGSITMHCQKCCPWPPLSRTQAEEIARILGAPKQPHELMRWRLRLYCGHVVEKHSHYTHKTLQAAFTGSTACPECRLDPATIIDGEAIGLAGEPPGPPTSVSRRPPKPTKSGKTKADLEAKVRELEAEVDRLRRR